MPQKVIPGAKRRTSTRSSFEQFLWAVVKTEYLCAGGRKYISDSAYYKCLLNFPLYCNKCKKETKLGVIKFKIVVSDEPDA